MKHRFSGAMLSLLMVLSLTACATEIQGSHSAIIQGVYGADSQLVDLPTQEPEDGGSSLPTEGQDPPDTSNTPDGSNTPDTSDGQYHSNPLDRNQDPGGSNASGWESSSQDNRPDGKSSEGNGAVDEDGWYTSKEEVALYIHLYERLPDNYVTKDEAEDAGWHGGNVERYTGEGTAIGGSRFGNREGLLPKAQGRTYTECDIDTVGGNARGAKRIVFSNDGLIYYTEDHYESFELLYGEP